MIRKTKKNKRNHIYESIIKHRKSRHRMLEGISNDLWNQIQTDEQGHWFLNGKKNT